MTDKEQPISTREEELLKLTPENIDDVLDGLEAREAYKDFLSKE